MWYIKWSMAGKVDIGWYHRMSKNRQNPIMRTKIKAWQVCQATCRTSKCKRYAGNTLKPSETSQNYKCTKKILPNKSKQLVCKLVFEKVCSHLKVVQNHSKSYTITRRDGKILWNADNKEILYIIEWANALVPPTPFQGGRTECA